jgi:ABC-2 type transport system permease protein
MQSRFCNFLFLIKREFGLFWSNKVFVVAFLILPALLAFVLGKVYIEGTVKHLNIVVVDKDISPMSDKLTDMISEDPVLHVVLVKHETVNLQQTMLDTRAVAIVVIPERFEASILQKHHPEINAYLNMANTITASAAGGAIATCAGTLNAGIAIAGMKRTGIPQSLAEKSAQPFQLNVFQLYNKGGSYLVFLWPGRIFSLLHQLLLMAMAVSFSQETESGTFSMTGILRYSTSALELLFVKMCPYLVLSAATLIEYYLLGLYFKVPEPAHPEALLLSQALLIFGACLLGAVYSIVLPLRLKATELIFVIASPAFTLSGFTWPADQLPAALAAFGKIIPLTPYLKSFRTLLLEGGSIQDVLLFMQHQLILVAVYFVIGMILLKLKIRKVLMPPKMEGES